MATSNGRRNELFQIAPALENRKLLKGMVCKIPRLDGLPTVSANAARALTRTCLSKLNG